MIKYLPILSILIITSCSSPKQEENKEPLCGWHVIDTENLPQKRHENAFICHEKRCYLLGGRGTTQVDIFDPKTNSWTQGDTLPFEMHHFQALEYGDSIIILGAFQGGFPDETPVPHVYIYNIPENRWIQGDSIPENRQRGAGGAVVRKGKIYWAGGLTDGHNGGHVLYFDEYDPIQHTWTALPDLPRKRDHFQGVIHKNQYFCIGGRETSNATGHIWDLVIPEVDVFDFGINMWMTLDNTQNLPTPRAGCGAVNIDQYIAIIGGESDNQLAHNEVELYNPSEMSWTKGDSLQQGRHGTQASFCGDDLYIAAGCGKKGGTPELESIEKINKACILK